MTIEDKRRQLKELIAHFANGNNAEFARFLGVSPQGVSTWLKRGTFDIELIYSKCVGISPEWLLTGKGDMLQTISDAFPLQSSIDNPLLLLIREKDIKIEEQAKTIGRLEERIDYLLKKNPAITVAKGVGCADAEK